MILLSREGADIGQAFPVRQDLMGNRKAQQLPVREHLQHEELQPVRLLVQLIRRVLRVRLQGGAHVVPDIPDSDLVDRHPQKIKHQHRRQRDQQHAQKYGSLQAQRPGLRQGGPHPFSGFSPQKASPISRCVQSKKPV